MGKFVFATNNLHKIEEIQQIIGNTIEIIGLDAIGCFEEIPETQETISGNAIQKARYIYEKYALNCFADDTGLEVEELNGAPGVYSARYAGPERSFEDNIQKLLFELNGKSNRKARFITIIALIIDNKEYLFEGIINGTIIQEKRGDKGFGYDSVFLPENSDLTFAQMNAEEKNRISHRGKAVKKLIEFLKTS
jgi:XTP/dITP diphosphohydrolase